MNRPYWDVVIAGGGLVGLALALALDTAAEGQLHIAVVEAAALPPGSEKRPTYRSGFDARSTALSRGSELILRDLGVWPTLAPHAAVIEHIHVSQRACAGTTELHAGEQGWPALGYVVENAWLGTVLLAAVRGRPAIVLHDRRHLHQIRVDADRVTVHNSAGEHYQARLLCITDGAGSSLAASVGIHCEQHVYHRSALITNMVSEQEHGGWAYERFTDNGPLALLPLPDHEGQHRSALIWSLPPARAAELAELPDKEFVEAAQQAFGYRQGRLLASGQRQIYPLVRSLALEQVRHRIAVMGNAAHALHPVAGQGFNLALRDVAALAMEVARASDSGDLSMLLRYSRQREQDQRRTTSLSHHLPGLFEWSQPGLGTLRGLGLSALSLFPGLRQGFGAMAAGCAPGMPQSVQRRAP